MNKGELRRRLVQEAIPKDSYSLEGGLPNNVYCLGKNGDIWETYYSEMGEKISLRTFDSEKDACEYFYGWLMQSLSDMGII